MKNLTMIIKIQKGAVSLTFDQAWEELYFFVILLVDSQQGCILEINFVSEIS